MIIDSDAPLTGWGATSQDLRTRGPCSLSVGTECTVHINCLELLVATPAVKTFLKDNAKAVAYINHLSLNARPLLHTCPVLPHIILRYP